MGECPSFPVIGGIGSVISNLLYVLIETNGDNSIKLFPYSLTTFIKKLYLYTSRLTIEPLILGCMRTYLLSILFVLVCNLIQAQSIFVTKNQYQADKKIYVTKYRYEADLIVYVTKYRYEAKEEGIWFYCKYPYQADSNWKIHFVKNKYQADLIIYYTNLRYQAGRTK